MTVRECDRCHEQTYDERLTGWVRVYRSHLLALGLPSLPQHELCASCARSLARWLDESPPRKADR